MFIRFTNKTYRKSTCTTISSDGSRIWKMLLADLSEPMTMFFQISVPTGSSTPASLYHMISFKFTYRTSRKKQALPRSTPATASDAAGHSIALCLPQLAKDGRLAPYVGGVAGQLASMWVTLKIAWRNLTLSNRLIHWSNISSTHCKVTRRGMEMPCTLCSMNPTSLLWGITLLFSL